MHVSRQKLHVAGLMTAVNFILRVALLCGRAGNEIRSLPRLKPLHPKT